MSFILDALRKSELERQRQSGPSIAELPVARDDRRLPAALVAIALLLAVNAAVLAWFLLRDSPAPSTVSPVLAAAEPASATVRAAVPVAAPPARPAGSADAQEPAPGDIPASRAPEAPDPTLLPDAPAAGSLTYESAPPPAVATLPQQPAGLPDLSVDLHIYADDPARRAVFINGRRYTEGMALAEGPMVEQITRDGAVINHRGQRYLLPRN
ncbi:MAG: general secretion pathway protein GspB [Gammaproteobacteria bacterium]